VPSVVKAFDFFAEQPGSRVTFMAHYFRRTKLACRLWLWIG